MARNESPPFERGMTLYNGDTIDAGDLQGVDWEGKEWLFEDRNANTGTDRTNRYVRCRVVRNSAAIALLPKRLVRFEADEAEYGARVDGYTATTGERGYPLDEYLPAAGVPVNDCAWIVVDGPAVCITDIAAAESNLILSGNRITSLTAATSGATTAGRAQNEIDATLAAATSGNTDFTAIFDQARNFVGRALSAKTTNSTDEDVLVEVGHW